MTSYLSLTLQGAFVFVFGFVIFLRIELAVLCMLGKWSLTELQTIMFAFISVGNIEIIVFLQVEPVFIVCHPVILKYEYYILVVKRFLNFLLDKVLFSQCDFEFDI